MGQEAAPGKKQGSWEEEGVCVCVCVCVVSVHEMYV